MLLKVNICHLSLQNDSFVKLSIALNTKILLKKLNGLLKTMLKLKMAFKSVQYEIQSSQQRQSDLQGLP